MIKKSNEKTQALEKLDKKNFAIQYTLYSLIVLIAWFFLILFTLKIEFNQFTLFISTYNDFANINARVLRHFFGNNYWLWWIPITFYFNFLITKKRLTDLGYSKWFSIINFYPLLFAILAIIDIPSLSFKNIGLLEIIFFAVLPVMKLYLLGILYLKN